MTKYRSRPVVIDAEQWFQNGDHSGDQCRVVQCKDGSKPFLSEGKVVRYFRHPSVLGHTKCKQCGRQMNNHGWIDTLEGGHIVCPGDFIITGVKGEQYPCKPDIFYVKYEAVEDGKEKGDA